MIISVFVFLGSIIFVGWTILNYLGIKDELSLFEIFALSYGLGMGLISLEIFFIFLLKLRISLWLILLPWIILFIINVARRRILIPHTVIFVKNLSKLEFFLISVIIFEILYAFFRAVIYPMESYDAVMIWALKAKAMYLANTLPISFFKNPNYSVMSHFDYPLLLPLQEMLFYRISNGINDSLVKLIFPTYFLSFIIIFFSIIKKLFDRKTGLLFTFVLATLSQVNDYATNGYADLVVSFYYSLAVLFIYFWYIRDRKEYIFFSAIFSSIGAWVKNEGIALCMLNFIILTYLYFLKEKKLKKIQKINFFNLFYGLRFYIFMMILFILPWYLFKISIGLRSDLFKEKTFLITHLPIIFYKYQIQFFDFKRWNILWLLFLLSILFNYKRIFSEKFLPITLSLLGVFGIYTLIYILTPYNIDWFLDTTVSRIFIHIAPLVVLWLAVISERFVKLGER